MKQPKLFATETWIIYQCPWGWGLRAADIGGRGYPQLISVYLRSANDNEIGWEDE